MGDETSTTGASSSPPSNMDGLTSALSQVLNQPQIPGGHDLGGAAFGIKLTGKNYGIWSQVMEMYIAARDKLGYIDGELPQPLETDPSFRKWRTENALVKGLLIGTMDPTLVGNFIRFPTAKAVWDAAATTYYDGSDKSQVYDLKRKVSRLRQNGGPLETYYNSLQGLWRGIDFRRPNPMTCTVDIQRYNTTIQEDRVYTFLDGLDDRLDNIRGETLRMPVFPTVEQAYANVRKEDQRQLVMMTQDDVNSSLALLSKGNNQKKQPGKKAEEGGCTHCGNPKHTKETCFKLHGYPEWWKDLKAKKKRESVPATSTPTEATKSGSNHSLVPIKVSSMATANHTSAQDDTGYSHGGDHWTWY